MSMQDLPIGRRRDDHPGVVQPVGVSTAPSWDSILERIAKLERSHAELARFVASIHEALPPEIAAATGRTLALGSPIDAVSPPPQFVGSPPPIFGTPPPHLPQPVDLPGVVAGIDPYTKTYEAPDPWAAPPSAGDFFQPLAAGAPFAAAAELDRPKRRFRGRRAAKQAQARIAAEFAAAAPPPPPGWGTADPMVPPPPPPPGFGTDSVAPDFGLPSGWGTADPMAPPPPPPGFASGLPNESFAQPPGWLGSAAGESVAPLPTGFAFDMVTTETAEVTSSDAREPSSWGTVDLTSPADFEFDAPPAGGSMAEPGIGVDASPQPPPGFSEGEYRGLSVVPPPPVGFGDPGDVPVTAAPVGLGAPNLALAGGPPPPPPGFGADAMPPPPPGFGADAMPPPPPGFGADAMPPPPPGFGADAMPPPPPGFGADAMPPPPPGFGADAMPPPPPGFGADAMPPPPPGFGADAMPPPPPGFGADAMPPPPPGFGADAMPRSSGIWRRGAGALGPGVRRAAGDGIARAFPAARPAPRPAARGR